jgi:hypothetical protein
MAFGDYKGPDKPGKGNRGGPCNRSSCQTAPAFWFNHGSNRWYCESCAFDIGKDYANQRTWPQDFARMFPEREFHPMFETQAMMDARAPKPVLVDGLRELLSKATQGEWRPCFIENAIYTDDHPEHLFGDNDGNAVNDLILTTTAINKLPAILDELCSLRADLEAARGALRPFARAFDYVREGGFPDKETLYIIPTGLNFGHLRRARDIVGKQDG